MEKRMFLVPRAYPFDALLVTCPHGHQGNAEALAGPNGLNGPTHWMPVFTYYENALAWAALYGADVYVLEVREDTSLGFSSPPVKATGE